MTSARRFACTESSTSIDGPLFLGTDMHVLSVPALVSAIEVLAANGVEVMIAEGDEYTPTPPIAYAIPTYNPGRKTGLAGSMFITPSHNPPHDRGFKYNAPNGGPAERIVPESLMDMLASKHGDCGYQRATAKPEEMTKLLRGTKPSISTKQSEARNQETMTIT